MSVRGARVFGSLARVAQHLSRTLDRKGVGTSMSWAVTPSPSSDRRAVASKSSAASWALRNGSAIGVLLTDAFGLAAWRELDADPVVAPGLLDKLGGAVG